ncbi:MAG: ABC transporter ATP-binding protein/permease [Erysipelotrichaceae bacterium]|nr:ABC transporter ATP-binding protein/permease [Erysipelotrichaceae bacterium]MCI1325817.1 ABC transporter ATP-binding protein/permease [Solobacterium sp.]MCH4044910.1 ABC transporter ATP-binding protein/permease [Erysipelotrichaceae bacterium]MCH4122122.1 ABC transporter ATP-binding protein/permease [Erysipelotrichaceae bacterium]MCI1362616.1 ABC transporter ATP-binding protein/permease [Solobacterium sp.]
MADEKEMKKYYLRYWWLALLAMLCKGLEVMADLVQPALMASIVDEGILGIGNGGTADLSIVKSLGLKMLVIIAAGGFAGWIGGVFSNNYGQRSGNDIRKDCFQKVLHFSFSQVDRFTPGSLITRVSSDVTQVQLMLSDMVRGCMRSLVFLVAGTWFLLSLDLNFRTILTIAIVLVLLEIIWTVWKTNPMFMSLQEKLDRVNTVMRENISGVRVVKAFAQEERENARFQKANHDLAKNQFEVLLRISYLQPVMNLVFNLAAAAIIRTGAIDVQAGSIEPGTVMAAVTYISLILNGLRMLATIFQNLSRGISSSTRLKEILDTRPDVVSGTVTQGTSKGTIAFDHVCFRYQKKSSDVLSDLNLEIHAGESIAIIGSTGSGKSSMINLIPRFYDVTHGTVKVDGVDVRDWDLAALRKRISVVMQKSELFSVSLRQNIAMGNPAASEQDIMEAAKTAQADDYIRAQRDGYDTMVAEGGTSLSGGQKQRLSIARALVKKAEILILDDATSALDLETEAALYNALRKQMHEMTTLVITQRIATARRCDRIVVLDHGCLVGVGRHEDLLAGCPVYADICSSQRMKGDARNG